MLAVIKHCFMLWSIKNDLLPTCDFQIHDPWWEFDHTYLKSCCSDPTDPILHRNQCKKGKIHVILTLLVTSKLDGFCCHGLDNFVGTHSPISYYFKTKFLTGFRRGWKGAYKWLALPVVELLNLVFFAFFFFTDLPTYVAGKKSVHLAWPKNRKFSGKRATKSSIKFTNLHYASAYYIFYFCALAGIHMHTQRINI